MARAPSGALPPRVCLLTASMDTHKNKTDVAEESKRLADDLDAAAKEVESAANVCSSVHRASQWADEANRPCRNNLSSKVASQKTYRSKLVKSQRA